LEHLARLESGIPGLDTILKGGLIAGASYIVQGRPGSGKTILASQIAFNHAQTGGRVLFATLLAESHERLFQFLSTLSFFDRERIGGEIQFVSAFDTLENEGLDEVVKLLRREISRQKASILVLDGVLNARSRAGNSIDTKKFIAELQGHAAFAGCTTLFLTSSRIDDSSPEHTMVDGVLELNEDVIGTRSVRRIHLRKTRGSSAISGLHDFEITDHGIHVHPRLETIYGETTDRAIPPGRLSTGIPEMDTMLGGGLPRSSITLLIGPSGAGKTTLGLSFIADSTPENPGLIFGFYETEPRLHLKAGALRIPLAAKTDSGAVQTLWQPTTERNFDALGARLLEAIRNTGATRVLIDSLGAFARTSTNPARKIAFFTALTNELRSLGVTVIATWEIQEMFDATAQGAPFELSSIFDNLLLIRLHEENFTLARRFSILKVRDSHYDATSRTMIIDDQGVRLAGFPPAHAPSHTPEAPSASEN